MKCTAPGSGGGIEPPRGRSLVTHPSCTSTISTRTGVALFEKCLELDLEGIVAKPEASPYRELKGKTTWVKVKNPGYTQAEGRRELLNERR